jgi:hypothetical protein
MENKLLKVYCGELIPNLEYLEILNPNFGFKKRKNIFGDKDVFDDFNEKIVEVVDDPAQCDFILIPHSIFRVSKNKEYVDGLIKISKDFSKKIIIFAIGDSTEVVDIPNSIVIRTSQYKSLKKDNEIIVPAYATDLSYEKPIEYRNKSQKPVIGFCGWAKTGGIKQKILFLIKNYFFLRNALKQGLYFRKKAISILSKSKLVDAKFIIRSSYSASEKTIELDAKKAREEYRKNMIESDFILSPKGDGNFSVRFYEALSLGRIPILIDTDCPLPMEDKIDYSKFILKVNHKDISKIDKIVVDFYSSLSDDEWRDMQTEAKKAFDQHLRIDVFLRYIFNYENHLLS